MNNTSSSANKAEIAEGENSSKTYNGSSYHMSNVGSRIKWRERHRLEMQKPLESRYHRNIKNVSLGNSENQVGKNHETRRTVKVMSATEEAGNVPQLSEKSHIQGKQADSRRTINDQQKLLNNSFISQNQDTQGKETSHVKHTNTIRGHVTKESHNSDTKNSPAKMNATLGKIEMEEANSTKNPAKKSSVPEKVKINFLIKGEASHLDQNNRNILQTNTSRIEKRPQLFDNVQNETKPLPDSKGKSEELTKSLYLTRNDSGVVRNSSNSDIGALFAKERFDNKTLGNITPPTTNSSSQLDASKIQTNVLTSFAQNKSKSKPDSTGSAAELSKPSHSTTNISREKNILDKVALSFHDNATGIRSESDIDTTRVKEHFGNRTLENLAPALAKAENVFAETYRTKDTQQSNSSFNEARATTSSNSSLADSFDRNNKIESYAARNVSNVPSEGDSNKKQAGGSRNTTNVRDKMKHNVLGNSKQMLDKGLVNAKSQVEQVLDNRINLTVDSSSAELQSEKEDVLSKKRTPNVAQEDFMKVSGNGRNVTDSNTIPQNVKVDVTAKERSQKGFQEDVPRAKHLNHSKTVAGEDNSALVLHTQEHKENHSSQGAKEGNQEKIRNGMNMIDFYSFRPM